MPRISAAEAGGANVCAFLDLIAWAEGTSISRFSKDDGYDVIVEGLSTAPGPFPKTFSGYAGHPNILVTLNRNGLQSTAAGRYQLLFRWWKPYRDLLQLKDFSPLSQDLVAIQQIRERGALGDVKEGRVREAIAKCSNIWASLPGAGYGQREHRIEDLVQQFRAAGGVVA